MSDVRWREGEGGLLVPHENDVEEAEARLMRGGPKCPAARLGRYTDTGRAYVMCGVERKAFPVRDLFRAADEWCCGDYAGADGGQLGPCPVWTAEKEGDPALQRTYAAQDKQAQESLTAHQIASGTRVDDKGHDPDLPTGTRELIEELESSGE
jgi:hypothetical protein